MFLKLPLLLRRLNGNPSIPQISAETGRKAWPKESKTTRGEERLGRGAVLTSEQGHGGGAGQTARGFSADSEATPTTRALRERGGAREATPLPFHLVRGWCQAWACACASAAGALLPSLTVMPSLRYPMAYIDQTSLHPRRVL